MLPLIFEAELTIACTASMKHVPNVLTIARILVTPLLLVLLMTESFAGQAWATVLFILAAISDYYDGKLARTYKVRSRLGQFLDPLADKVLVLGTFVALAVLLPDLVPWWAVALIALRDLVVTGIRTWAESRGNTIATSSSAKWKTTFQLTFLISTLVFLSASKMPGVVGTIGAWMIGSWVLYVLLLMVVVVTVWTGGEYVMRQEYTSPTQFNS